MEKETMFFCGVDVSVGDFIQSRIINKKGDRNLDGCILSGHIKDLVPDFRMVRLDSGWCCHEKDELIEHIPGGKHHPSSGGSRP